MPDAMLIFFFQAEDGIRDVAVTGVQTCALPIFRDGFERVAGKAGGLPGTRSGALRTVCGRGRVGGRLGEARPRPQIPSHPAAQRKNPQRRESALRQDRKSTRLNSSHGYISYAVFCLKKKKKTIQQMMTLIENEIENITDMVEYLQTAHHL